MYVRSYVQCTISFSAKLCSFQHGIRRTLTLVEYGTRRGPRIAKMIPSTSFSNSSGRSDSSMRKMTVSSARVCEVCSERPMLGSNFAFLDHIRLLHCTKEGGSYVCNYGPSGICQSLPMEGVSSYDYEKHVQKFHVNPRIVPDDCSSSPTQFASSADSDEVLPTLHSSGSISQLHTSSSGMSQVLPRSATQPVLTTPSTSFNIYTGTQNLSSVLSDPRRTRHHTATFFTRLWGDSFVPQTKIAPSARLVHITFDHFRDYWQTTARKYQKQMKHRRCLAASRAALSVENPVSSPLKDIPLVFWDAHFTLSDPEIFAKVFLEPEEMNAPGGGVDLLTTTISPKQTPSKGPPQKSTNPFDGVDVCVTGEHGNKRRFRNHETLQQTLERYHDLIESRLGAQLESKSGRFYEAVLSHGRLAKQLGEAQESAARLRADMKLLEETFVTRSLKILSMHKSRTNLEIVKEKLVNMQTVRVAPTMVRSLLREGNYPAALDVIQTTQEVLCDDLDGVLAFRHLNVELAETRNLICKVLQEEFVKAIQTEFAKPVLGDADMNVDEGQLVPVVLGLLRVKEFRFCEVLREEISISVKNLLRTTVKQGIAGFEDAFDFDPSVSLADQTRKMTFDQWLKLLEAVFERQLCLCNHVKTIEEIILDLIDIAGGKGSSLPSSGEQTTGEGDCIKLTHLKSQVSPEVSAEIDLAESDWTQIRASVANIAGHACVVSQERACRLLTARAKDGSLERLPVEVFLRLWRCTRVFESACDALCANNGARSTTLRQCVYTHASRLINRMHEEKKAKLGNILDSEHWKAAEVPDVFQKIVDHCQKTGLLRDSLQFDNEDEKTPIPYLVVDNEKYVVVGTSLLLLQMIAQYCHILEQMPFCAHDLLSRLIDLLKYFNSRTCQLILGAGAVQLVGLKTISSRNLALAARCLQLIALFIPVAQHEFERHLTESQTNLMRHFTQILKDYEDHIQEIFNKIISVMDVTLWGSLTKWEFKGQIPSASFQTIAKQVKRCHEGITGILPNEHVQRLFFRIHDNFKAALRQQLKALGITPQNGPLYGLVCSEFSFYMETLRSLPICAALNDTLADVMTET